MRLKCHWVSMIKDRPADTAASRMKEAQAPILAQGADAAIAGAWYHDNTYPAETHDHHLWLRGFDEGREVVARTQAAMKKFKD